MADRSDSPDPAHPSLGLVDTSGAVEPCFQPRLYTPISEELLTHIVDLYTEGKSLLQISKMEGLPSTNAIYRLHRDNEVFRERIAQARITRALQAEEKIETLGEEAQSLGKDDVPGARLAFDIHRFRAEVNDPATYGKRTTVAGDSQRPIVFQFVSHIPGKDPVLPDIPVEGVPVDSEEPPEGPPDAA